MGWTQPALAVDRRVRGCTPAPGAWTTLRGERVKLGPVRPVTVPDPAALRPVTVPDPAALRPGVLRVGRTEVLVGTATGPVALGAVQPPGKRAMAAADWARGARVRPGRGLRMSARRPAPESG